MWEFLSGFFFLHFFIFVVLDFKGCFGCMAIVSIIASTDFVSVVVLHVSMINFISVALLVFCSDFFSCVSF